MKESLINSLGMLLLKRPVYLGGRYEDVQHSNKVS